MLSKDIKDSLYNVACTKCGAVQAVRCVIGGGGAGDIRHG